MSILIKGMKVHRGRCWECPCLDHEYGNCNVLKKDVHYVAEEGCPLIDLPDHGDLIDRDVLLSKVQKWYWEALETVKRMPTVIPAERSE